MFGFGSTEPPHAHSIPVVRVALVLSRFHSLQIKGSFVGGLVSALEN